jgi:hypothetical protein
MRTYDRFACVDWSGAKGNRHKGIALAWCEQGTKAPILVAPPGEHWSRQDVADWLLAQQDRILIDFDFSFAPPFVERGSYLPGEAVPENARAFWAYVDAQCDDVDLGAASLLEQRHRGHFYFGAADGQKADFMHLRQCEAWYNAQGGGKPSTVYDVIGAAQVAKASFSGMRFLHHISKTLPIWPFDPPSHSGPQIIEIYTQIAARAAGMRKGRSKIRDPIALDAALSALGSQPHIPMDRYTDHATDAILTAAWLRKNAENQAFWNPAQLNLTIASTEGWTFGVI